MPSFQANFDTILRFGGTALIVVGIFLVVQPFLSALLFAGVLAIATWPLFLRLRRAVGGSSTVAASAMLALILVLVIIPIALLSAAAAEQLPGLATIVREWMSEGLHAPESLNAIPVIGERLYTSLQNLLADKAQIVALMQRVLEPAGRFSLAVVRTMGEGILQLLLVAFIVFFYYRDGERLIAVAQRVSDRLSGRLSEEVMTILTGTTRSVFVGLVGTAAAQAVAALIGFLIAGVPAAFLLSVGTFVLSVVPMGPVVMWGGAAIWLYAQGEPGWAIFMVVWGAVVISSIDNFVKPILIARGSTLSLGLIFIGVILGPVLLALGVALFRAWISAHGPREAPASVSARNGDSLLPPRAP